MTLGRRGRADGLAICVAVAAPAGHQAGDQPDPRDAQIARLTNEVTALKQRLAESARTINELTEFRPEPSGNSPLNTTRSSACGAAITAASRVRRLPQRTAVIGSCS